MQETAVDVPGKTEHIEVFVTAEQKALLERAAKARAVSLSAFVVASLERVVEETIGAADGVITLSPRDSAIVADALLNPPEPTEALRAAMRRHGYSAR